MLKEKNGSGSMIRFEKALMLSKALSDRVSCSASGPWTGKARELQLNFLMEALSCFYLWLFLGRCKSGVRTAALLQLLGCRGSTARQSRTWSACSTSHGRCRSSLGTQTPMERLLTGGY